VHTIRFEVLLNKMKDFFPRISINYTLSDRFFKLGCMKSVSIIALPFSHVLSLITDISNYSEPGLFFVAPPISFTSTISGNVGMKFWVGLAF